MKIVQHLIRMVIDRRRKGVVFLMTGITVHFIAGQGTRDEENQQDGATKITHDTSFRFSQGGSQRVLIFFIFAVVATAIIAAAGIVQYFRSTAIRTSSDTLARTRMPTMANGVVSKNLCHVLVI